ncbi:MAG: leucyl aminopeptidase family protein [Hyphomicrobiales bacterium]|nr:leucyl aminopeptidase family protein [Hyphomicrobiales bacterium]
MTETISTLREQIAKLFLPENARTLPIWLIGADGQGMDALPPAARAWVKAAQWKPAPGQCLPTPGENGLGGAVMGVGDAAAGYAAALAAGGLAPNLPPGDYHLETPIASPEMTALAWALGEYHHHAYHSGEKRGARRLKPPSGAAVERALDVAQAVWLARDLINTPANDCGPAEIETAVRGVARVYGAQATSIVGDDLLVGGFRLHHAVGRASDRAPRLIDLRWGDQGRKITLVGKGVTFDTGGLNIKGGASMALMKKDMGGAASALALAAMLMAARAPIRLRLLIPAADNVIASNAFRPGDVIESRAGVTVEIGNTDAEGRLLLADALHLADEEAPDALIAIATLTGAARVALGPDLPPFYTENESFAAAVADAGARVGDPLWRMPLWRPYESYLKSDVADINNAGGNGFAGSITAALFLRRFVRKATTFAHFDIYGWTPRPAPGKPMGGEPQAARALFEAISTGALA